MGTGVITNRFLFFFLVFFVVSNSSLFAQKKQSVARLWNEELLKAISIDFARPTIHARNLFHTSLAMYDAWAVFDDTASTFLLNQKVRDFRAKFYGIAKPADISKAQEEAISYAAYRVLMHRFKTSPGAYISIPRFVNLFQQLGYDSAFRSTDYSTGSSAALGNYVGEKVIQFGKTDGSNEADGYNNKYYTPLNSPLKPYEPGNYNMTDPNRWQPLAPRQAIDQGGNPINGVPPFLGPEWGKVVPFALTDADLKKLERDGNEYWVYNDPGPPPYLTNSGDQMSKEYMWSFTLVSIWASHLDPSDKVMVDISPASQGNVGEFPKTIEGLQDFYNLENGGDKGKGYTVNPKTGAPYNPQIVPRGDYTRVLAEFWADGPNSVTPPGHWFKILNYVNDHPLFEKKFGGKGDLVNDLEWDVKSYLTLGGALHDAAVTAWGIKGYYDYIRPISAIRYLAFQGQCSDPALPNYNVKGIPLKPGFIEQVKEGDSLAGYANENIGKIKLYTWRGPDYIKSETDSVAGVGWILAENWWPYQRPTFVTPPFAGYISGHSTFSRAAAEVMTLLTGDEYFPGGVSEFHANKNEFLVFEKGPSVDIVLQWAKYKDASDQCSLSRIWGGIHPPADDIPGRLIGEKIGVQAFNYAMKYFTGEIPNVLDNPETAGEIYVYPNPVPNKILTIDQDLAMSDLKIQVLDLTGRIAYQTEVPRRNGSNQLNLSFLSSGVYILRLQNQERKLSKKIIIGL